MFESERAHSTWKNKQASLIRSSEVKNRFQMSLTVPNTSHSVWQLNSTIEVSKDQVMMECLCLLHCQVKMAIIRNRTQVRREQRASVIQMVAHYSRHTSLTSFQIRIRLRQEAQTCIREKRRPSQVLRAPTLRVERENIIYFQAVHRTR